MSLHEKEGNKKNLHQADNPSLHLCFKKWFALFGIGSERHKIILYAVSSKKQEIIVCR